MLAAPEALKLRKTALQGATPRRGGMRENCDWVALEGPKWRELGQAFYVEVGGTHSFGSG